MKWKTLEQKQIFKSGFVKIDQEKCELPDGRIMPAYYILRLPNWVNIVPFTAEGEVILIRQYRHATKSVHWEVPGGAVDPGEDPVHAAHREMAEETGYQVGKLVPVAENYPNPALQDNRIYTYVALDCAFKGPQELDPFEEIEVHKIPYKEFRQWVSEGKFNHNIVVASIYLSIDYLEKNKIFFRENPKNP
jgi:ADP-ribose pyrophosphatase